jgi:polygalacturonase
MRARTHTLHAQGGGDGRLPNVPVMASLRDYGAVGDGRADDSAALERALADPKVASCWCWV